MKNSVHYLRNLIVIWDVLVVLWFSTHTVFTGLSSDEPGYNSSLAMMPSHTCTGYGCFPVHQWVSVEFLTLFFCILNGGENLSVRCMQTIL